MLALQSDIMDVNQIFKDLGMLVHEQGEVIGMCKLTHDVAIVNPENMGLSLIYFSLCLFETRENILCVFQVMLQVHL